MKKLSLILLLALLLLCLGLPSLAADSRIADGSSDVYLDGEPRFTDHELIGNKLAISVLVKLGVVDGYPQEDGSFVFLPEKAVTRAEMAKMICYIKTGGKFAAEDRDTVAAFTDMPEDHWALPYVEYCAANGIISGRGDGIFDPEGTVTPHEALKMLLVAMGYDNEQFLGDGWQQVVMDYYYKLGMRANDDGMVIPALDTTVSEHGGSRHNIALAIYRALFVIPEGNSVTWLEACFGAEKKAEIDAYIAGLLTPPEPDKEEPKEEPEEDKNTVKLSDLPIHTEMTAFIDTRNVSAVKGGYTCDAYDMDGKYLSKFIFEDKPDDEHDTGVVVYKIMSDGEIHFYNSGDDYMPCESPYTVTGVANAPNEYTVDPPMSLSSQITSLPVRSNVPVYLVEDGEIKEIDQMKDGDTFFMMRSDSGRVLALFVVERQVAP